MVDRNQIEEIREQINIVDIISQYVNLNKKGTNQGLRLSQANHEKRCEKFQNTRTRPSL